jgi:dCTP deaminase
MTFWTNKKLEDALRKCVDGFHADNIKQAGYELGVADEYAITTPDGEGARIKIQAGEMIRIAPGQFALLLTQEIVRVPAEVLGLISVKASWKLKGLVNISGFHVDPGFHGRLKFAVYNASGRTLVIEPKRRFFVLWFCGLSEEIPKERLYNGTHQAQEGIRDEDVSAIGGMVASPAGLSKRVDGLRSQIRLQWVVIALLVTALVAWAIADRTSRCTPQSSPTTREPTAVAEPAPSER